MNKTVTIELPSDLAEWVQTTARENGMSLANYVSTVLDVARARTIAGSPFQKYVGTVKDTVPDLSSRKGFDRG
jgi:hypothetical protein